MNKRNLLTMALAFILAMPSVAQKKNFEGEFEFTNTVTADKTLRKLYKWIRNGEYKMSFVRKWPDEKVVETYQGTTCLILRSKNIAYVWSDLLKTGYSFDYKAYEDYLLKLHKDAVTDVRATGEEKEINGYPCKRYKGTETITVDLFGAPMKTTEEHDYWVCEDYPDEYVGSTHVEGMPFYFEENARVGLPLVGEASQHQALELSSIKEREVSDEELAVPADIKFTKSDDGYGAMQKVAKEIRKYKKKNNISDDGVKMEGVAKEQGEWDF